MGEIASKKKFDKILGAVIWVCIAAGALVGIGLGAALWYFLERHIPRVRNLPFAVCSWIFCAFEAAAGVICAWLLRMLQKPMDSVHRERVAFLAGGQTEALVAYELQDLDNQWHLFNNVAMKGGGDIDHVLVGPSGVYCLSTKSSKGWYEKDVNGRLTLNRQPTDHLIQCQRMAIQLRHWLEARLHSASEIKNIPFVRPVLVAPLAYRDFDPMAVNVWVVNEKELLNCVERAGQSLKVNEVNACIEVMKDLTGWNEHSKRNEVQRVGKFCQQSRPDFGQLLLLRIGRSFDLQGPRPLPILEIEDGI